jgi:hypothetical protein
MLRLRRKIHQVFTVDATRYLQQAPLSYRTGIVWRGLARTEREARAGRRQLSLSQVNAPHGARCGRDARGPSKELES